MLNHFIKMTVVGITLFVANAVFAAEPSLTEVYASIEAGQLAKAEGMMREVLKNHPNSAKAHYVEAELFVKEGKLDLEKAEFAKAETLAPGLPFAAPDSVQKLQSQLTRVVPQSRPVSESKPSVFGSSLFWILLVVLIIGVIHFLRKRPQPVQVFSAPGNNYPNGTSAYPNAPMGYQPPMGQSPGIGSGLMGSLASGAALGAGLVAGEALAHNLLGDNHPIRVVCKTSSKPQTILETRPLMIRISAYLMPVLGMTQAQVAVVGMIIVKLR